MDSRQQLYRLQLYNGELPRSRPTARWSIVVACSVFALFLVGCSRSEKLSPVSGKVTYQGKAISEASIRFSNPETGIDLTTRLGADGSYAFEMAQGKGMPAGTYQVAVVPVIPETPMGPIQQPTKTPERPDIPAKYRDPATSGLKLTVKPGDNHFDIDI